MTNEEMNTTIAKALGWTKCDPVQFVSDELWHLKGRGFSLEKDLPDYVHDLNDMHQAEKILTPEQESLYVFKLAEMIMGAAYCGDYRWTKSTISSSDSTYRATARQRAEAFIATLAK